MPPDEEIQKVRDAIASTDAALEDAAKEPDNAKPFEDSNVGDDKPADEAAPVEEDAKPDAEAETDADEDAEGDDKPEVKPAKTPWEKKRIARLSQENKNLKQRLADLEAAGNAKPTEEKDTYTKEDLDAAASEKARVMLQEEQSKAWMQQHDQSINRIANEASKETKEFNRNLSDMVENMGAVPMPVQVALIELESDAAKVLTYLVGNPDEAAKFYEIASPTKIAIELAKIAQKLSKPVVKAVSKAPPPISPVGGNRTGTVVYSDADSDSDWMAKRNKEVEGRVRR